MRRLKQFLIVALALATVCLEANAIALPWQHGKLQVSDNHRYLQHEDGTPFFWLGETGWLLPERLDRNEVAYYLGICANLGYNVVQVQTINGVPAYNVYGEPSHKGQDLYDFSCFDGAPDNSYWGHMDYIVEQAQSRGIYIGMVCIWGGLVKAGLMNEEQAVKYGTFLAERYKGFPNIIWIIGGDQRGDVKPEVWETLARTIRSIDPDHLMTYHPRGRTCSSTWWNEADWLDINMFQSGHRRYGQRNGDGDYTIAEDTEEDSWRYIQNYYLSLGLTENGQAAGEPLGTLKPILDGEPSYERIPQGLHDIHAPQWQAHDVRRYAYWSVFGGACGHTYGNNALMQFYRPGVNGAYGCTTPWWEALGDPGFRQMQYLKRLILAFPYFERIPDQSLLVGSYGEKYHRPCACRGKDYMLVYSYTAEPIRLDLTRISGERKHVWWYDPASGCLIDGGIVRNSADRLFKVPKRARRTSEAVSDVVLIVTDAAATYVEGLSAQ